MRVFSYLLIGLVVLAGLALAAPVPQIATAGPPWGFYGHRQINHFAVFTLDPAMMRFFRHHRDYLAEHAVDPDKRRYATEHEAVRHYIDLDHWGRAPFPDLPRNWVDALLRRARIEVVDPAGDSLQWRFDTLYAADPAAPYRNGSQVFLTSPASTVGLRLGDYRNFWYRSVFPALYDEPIRVAADSVAALGLPVAAGTTATVHDDFSAHGILPYHLLAHHRRLTEAFAAGHAADILRLAAEIGHYVGDAHVPLHTTENYNGQLTGQLGIHAFWESRLPELFAEKEYDFLVGPATYIADPQRYYWDVVLDSHALVDSVLRTERRLAATYPADRQFCFDERLGREIRTQCPEYARAWSAAMDGMVEDRFRASILSVGSVWYSCWVDAGQPELDALLGRPLPALADTLDAAVGRGRVRGRPH